VPNRLAEYFDDDDEPRRRTRVIEYRSFRTADDGADHLVGKLVVIGIFLVPAIIFAVIVIYAWMMKY